MLESQWLEKRDNEVQQALSELDLYTPEAQRVIIAESRRRKLDEQKEIEEPDDAEERVLPGSGGAFRDLFTTRGRISRLSYLGRIVGCGVFNFVVGAAAAASRSVGGSTIGGVLILLVWPFTFEITIAAGIRRCHDMNQSGWWLLLYMLVPFAILILVFPEPFWEVRVFASLIFAYTFAVLILVFRKGTAGPNRFDLEAPSSTAQAESPNDKDGGLLQDERGAVDAPADAGPKPEPMGYP